ncbi:LOW QUALITY PROTEIN: dynein axonemal heavy chain 6-like [Lycodopsis pacificus]
MASQGPASPRSGGRRGSRERLQLPELPSATAIFPRPPVVQKTQAVLKRRWKQPSMHHLKDRERMYFPGWDTQLPSSQQTEQPHRRREELPVRLPSLISRTTMSQNVVPTPIPPILPLSLRYLTLEDVDTPSEQLEEEEYYYSKLIRIPFFANFKMWKPFNVWRTKVRAKKFHVARRFLQSSLLIESQSLNPALMDIRNMCYQISDTDLCHMEKEHTHTLQEFQDILKKQLQEVLNDLRKFQELVKEVTVCACRNYMTELGAEATRSMEGILFDEQNKKYRFIRLVDYMVANTMHIIVVNTVAVLQEQVGGTPSRAAIQSWSLSSEVDPPEEEMSQKSEACCGQPLLFCELMLDLNALTYQPSEEDVQSMCEFLFAIVDFQKFEHANEYNSCLESILEKDKQLLSSMQEVKESFQFAFDAAKVYLHTFERFHLFYKENEGLDLDAMRQKDHDVSFFGKALELYHSELKEAAAIPQKKRLGSLLVDKTLLKEKLASSSLRCLEVIHQMLTQQARVKLDAVIAEVCEVDYQLESSPSTTAELANSLTLLDGIWERIAVIEAEQETLCQMYSLINVYSVPRPTEDLLLFATLQPSVYKMYCIISEALLERGSIVGKLHSSLKKDIKELNREVIQTKLKSLNPQLLDINADSSQVRLLLEGVQVSIDKLQAQAHVHTSYQEELKVEVTHFDALEELSAEFRLKQLLWDSLEEWDSLSEGWRQSTLEQLDLQQISSQVTTYSKYIKRLEEGLPSNNIVTTLKEKVEVTRQRLPVITDLCNPSAKSEHWTMLESVAGTSLNRKHLTLAAVEACHVFSYGPKIQEACFKVKEVWGNTAFTVLSHGDSEDGSVLGGTDDIQVLLDDSIISLGRVASSRYVAPIKHVVNILLGELTHFNQTLDEWLTCQRNWLHLGSIFLAPDMERQLPAQSKMFFKVDKSWKEIMAKVKLRPNVLQAATRSHLLETFQHNNTLLDEIQKGLENYLESKRVIFPSQKPNMIGPLHTGPD